MMHTRGRPTEWRTLAKAGDIVSEVEHDLANRVQVAFESGVQRGRIVLDPGFGFGKNFEDNYPLAGEVRPVSKTGLSAPGGSFEEVVHRTKRLRSAPGSEVTASERLNGSIAAMVACILQGAHIVRVHDVKESVEAAAVADAILGPRRIACLGRKRLSSARRVAAVQAEVCI